MVERYNCLKNQLWLGKFAYTILSYVLPYVKNKNILDAACGSGWAEPILIKSGAKHVDAFDKNKKITKHSIKYVNFVIKDFNVEDFGKEKYDLAISMETIEHLKNYNLYLKNLVKSLKKGGLLFLSTPNGRFWTGKNEFHLKEFTLEEMKTMFKENGLKIVNNWGISTGTVSKVAAKIVPTNLVKIIKKTILYKLFVDYLSNFPQKSKLNDSECLIFLCKKI